MNTFFKFCVSFVMPKITAAGLAIMLGPDFFGNEAFKVLVLAPYTWAIDLFTFAWVDYSLLDWVDFFVPGFSISWQFLLVDSVSWFFIWSLKKDVR